MGRQQKRVVVAAGVALAALGVATTGVMAASATWTGNVNNQWTTDANWSGVHPDGAGEIATFNAASGNTNVSVGGTPITIKQLIFTTANAASYTVGSGSF